ncbi:Anion exchange protein 2 [Pseudolycoriella hygida]|uniref:Anion exchange protein n=1 Tax=Pseudolycoriella hygida TaxID=35572 RepID=A0A9Q0N6M9_9DIPT|nr:Anion exchange protein 2 [Pseudolycoriella hygida]
MGFSLLKLVVRKLELSLPLVNFKRRKKFIGLPVRKLRWRKTDKNADPDEVKLDTEMEKVFAGPDRDREKFDVAQFRDDDNSRKNSKYSDQAYDTHRTKRNGSRKPSSMKRRDSSQENSPDKTVNSASSTATGSPTSTPLVSSRHIDDEPLISQRAGHAEHLSDSSSDERRVQFNKKKANQKEVLESPDNDSENDDHRKRKGRHQHYKSRKTSLQDTSTYRRPIPSEGAGRRVSIQPEDTTLQEVDIDELTSHRSDDPRGMRRHKIQPSERSSRRDKEAPAVISSPKKHFDHSPHEVFVQLDELIGTGEDREWKETARWIKYEEDVEEGSDRWGRPHVASLSFHSLLNLRRCLETGVVLMDLEEKDLPGVAYRVVEQMVAEELILEDDKVVVMRSLLLRHRHVNEHSHSGFPFGGSRRKFSSYTSLQTLWMEEDPFGVRGKRTRASIATPTTAAISLCAPEPYTLSKEFRRHSSYSYKINLSNDAKSKIQTVNDVSSETKIDMKEETYSSSQEDLKRTTNDTILKRIPVGAEATTVLVGAVDFLKQPTIAFVRLAEGISIPGITEVPIPVRFIFILLGPKTVELDYHEVGRSIATLMTNEHFHKIAYKADDRRDLLSAINEFLDESIVLPPGNWQRDDLLPFNELKAKSEWIRERKTKALQQKNKDKQAIVDEEKQLLASAGDGDGGKKPPKGPLEKTHRPWGGLINDAKRRLPMYKSDITDGFNSETLAATLFMYFAALSTAITFGGLASEKTHNLIGISETLISASFVGLIFHALSGQPLTIVGTTGPLLLFDEALYQFCLQHDYEFLTVRIYVGIWMAVIAVVVSAFEGSVYVRLFTRFTQEIFSALITLIYLVETLLKLVKVYQRHPLHKDYVYIDTNVAPIAEALTLESGDEINNTSAPIVDSVTTASTEAVTQLVTLASKLAEIANTTLDASDKTEGLIPSDQYGMLNQPNTALFCTILTLGTFTVAFYLKLFRNSHFLGRNARRALGDFGVPISIAIFVTVDYLIPEVYTEKLSVPEGISPSDPIRRGWLIPLGPVPTWLPFAAIVPSILVYILVFMETHISELIVDKPERGLKKGSGLHLDIVLLSFLNTFCGFFGMPWHCAATVRSVTHVSSVTIMSRTHAPGDKPHIVDVKEQRVSGLVVSFLVGCSVAMAPLLRLIPMAVLFGIFLYMGVSSMIGVQFFDRLRLFTMPVKYHPSEEYVKRVPTWKMHIFTLAQVLSLAVLWAVKSSSISLAFPFVLVMMVPLRQYLGRMYNEREINALDGSAAKIDPSDEADFYEQTSMPA